MFENSRYPIAPITPNGVDKRYSIADINELPVMLKDDSATLKRQEIMNRQANASAKSKEVQRPPQADTQLHHICFCPNAPRHSQTDINL